jgi:glutathione synthase/RimK-type ligase-like ATP-grasp enzyme
VSSLTDGDRLLAGELRAFGHTVAPVVWSNSDVHWADFDLLVLRSCWDYHRRPAEFLAWLETLERLNVRLLNPLDTVRWNIHKSYLSGFASAGLRTAETAYVASGSHRSLASIMDEHGWSEAVVKPAISATAEGTWRVDREGRRKEADFEAALEKADLLVQRFVPEITSQGEWSLVFLDRAFSHAVLKRPTAGDFRVQKEYGGTVVARHPEPAFAIWAQSLTNLIPGAWAYARVDAVHTALGYLLMEVECIEPELFFSRFPEAAGRAAEVFLAHV